MIGTAAHFKGAVWGPQCTLGTAGMQGTNCITGWPLLNREGHLFLCALMPSAMPVGCRRPGRWSALCEEVPIPLRVSLRKGTAACSPVQNSQTLVPVGSDGHWQRLLHSPPVSTVPVAFRCFPINHHLTRSSQHPCELGREGSFNNYI